MNFRLDIIFLKILFAVCGIGLAYWLVFAFPWDSGESLLAVFYVIVSFSFIFGVPFVMGMATAYLGCRFRGRTIFWIYVAPALFVLLAILFSVLFALEAIFCAVVAAPILVPCAFLGGLLGAYFQYRHANKISVSFVVMLPLLVAPLESRWKHPHQTVTVHNQILIDAPLESVWNEIASVREIQKEELPANWIYWLDFPRPKAAEIDFHGVGGTRTATFERDVSFFEVVTEWNKPRALAFTIDADPDFIPHTAFDKHIVVGGRFFDVLSGRYELEAQEKKTILHLSSQHQLATPFNDYAGWWSSHIMHSIQKTILVVIQQRAESTSIPMVPSMSAPHHE